jgi:hypothetical protein
VKPGLEAVAVPKGSHFKGMKYAWVRVIEAGSLAPGGAHDQDRHDGDFRGVRRLGPNRACGSCPRHLIAVLGGRRIGKPKARRVAIGGTTSLSATPMTLPPEIVDHIIDLTGNHGTLQACSLVAKNWVARSRVHLFRDVLLFSHRRWQKDMPVGPTSPAIYTRTLTLAQHNTPHEEWINADILYPFLSHLRDFKNVENLILDGWDSSKFSADGLKKYFGHFGARLRSLELGGEGMSPGSFLVLLGLFPNLEDLSVKEPIRGAEASVAPAVSPKLSGRLTIGVYTTNLFPTICKTPLRFREICLQDHRYDYQELINACAKTLVDFRAMSLHFSESRFEIPSFRLINSSQINEDATSLSGSAKRSKR